MNGLQNQLARLNPGLVGSIPTRSRYRAEVFVLHLAELLVLHRAKVLVLFLSLMAAVSASPLQAQQPATDPSQDSTEAVEGPESPRRNSPGGAFVRSMMIPGWGQAAAGSPGRGAFYFTVESVGVWMILKTSKTLGSANDILAMRRLEAEERLSADPSVDPADLASAIDADPEVMSALELKQIRRQQREDWLSFGVFFLLLGGADAFVAAHLAEFPEPLEVAIRPLPDMGVEVGFSLVF